MLVKTIDCQNQNDCSVKMRHDLNFLVKLSHLTLKFVLDQVSNDSKELLRLGDFF